jgi:hypothetical protein
MPRPSLVGAAGALAALVLLAAPFAACTSGGGLGAPDDGGLAIDDDGFARPYDAGDAGGDGSVQLDASAVKDAAREANVPECPAAYSASPPGHCTVGVRCGYDQGTCECAGYCGGAAPPPDTDFTHWQCAPTRTDGCPDAVPAMGTACAPSGKQCQYDDCCAATVTCQSGAWSSPLLSCPP